MGIAEKPSSIDIPSFGGRFDFKNLIVGGPLLPRWWPWSLWVLGDGSGDVAPQHLLGLEVQGPAVAGVLLLMNGESCTQWVLVYEKLARPWPVQLCEVWALGAIGCPWLSLHNLV